MNTAIAIVTTLSPVLAIALLLEVAARRDRQRELALARQVWLTDAIAAELGAVAAPVVTKRWGRPWQVRIAVPFGHPGLVARVLVIAHRVLERVGLSTYEVVLTPREPDEAPREPGARAPALVEVSRRAA